MGWWLAGAESARVSTFVKRFDPVYWTVDFPRPMMAAVVTTGPHALRVDAVFYRKDDLAGLIWWAEDRVDHPLLRYATSRDFRGCVLSFAWRSAGVQALDAINGPTLTIEGRDAAGAAKSWFVRLWNYAVGDPEDAVVTLDFDALDGGFVLPGEADPVFAGDIDRMFISLVPEGFDNSDAPLAATQEAWVELADMRCDGAGSVLRLGDVQVPPHGAGIATGYDDAYNVTPARLLRNIQRLGYEGAINHYVGMSHYFRLERVGAQYLVSLAGGALNVATAAWHVDFAERARAAGFGLIVSLSYELFDANCWGDWKQRAANGDPAATGYVPPSTLLSPAVAGAMGYLQAVARAIVGIGRIWADGKLLRGAAGDFKSETGFRVYTGSEGQGLDPLIAGREGIGGTPAYRGIAYAVFEDMQLGDFGNRIPSLSFEVIADAGATSAGAVIGALGGIASDGGAALTGVAAQGDSVRGVAEALAAALPFSLVDGVGGLTARFGPGVLRGVARDDRGAGRGRSAAALAVDRSAATTIPEIVTLAYNDVGRDYLMGSQRARRDSAARREVRIDLPATVDAAGARSIAEARLTRAWAERTTATVTLPWRAIDVSPGDRVVVPGLNGEWRVASVAFEAMVVRLALVQWAAASAPVTAADTGRPVREIDQPHGPTTLAVLDLPQLSDTPENSVHVAVAASGASAGWRRAGLLASTDSGARFSDAGSTAFPAIMGRTVTALGAGPCALVDRVNPIEVQLLNAAMMLSDADDVALLAGSNLALIGEEALQFARAEPLGAGRWRLSDLWRGRRGTEWAAGGHPADTGFVMLDPLALRRLPDALAVGGLTVMAVGVGDATGAVATGPVVVGKARLPLAPVALDVRAVGADREVRWLRRSRDGWAWRDTIEAPLGEEREAYRVTKRASGRADLASEVMSPIWTYAAAERAADFAAGALTVMIEVVQIGTFGASPPVTITIPTN
ncbi:MAG: phage tail protein [Sphingomonadaceae bacterium]